MELRVISKNCDHAKRKFAPNAPYLWQFVHDNPAATQVHGSMARRGLWTVAKGPGANKMRGAAANTVAIAVTFADVDLKQYPNFTLEQLEAHIAAQMAILKVERWGLTKSGGGFHLLVEIVPLVGPVINGRTCALTEADVSLYKRVARAMARFVGCDPSPSEPARMARLPGSLNHKPEYGEPRATGFEICGPRAFAGPLPWALADLEAALVKAGAVFDPIRGPSQKTRGNAAKERSKAARTKAGPKVVNLQDIPVDGLPDDDLDENEDAVTYSKTLDGLNNALKIPKGQFARPGQLYGAGTLAGRANWFGNSTLADAVKALKESALFCGMVSDGTDKKGYRTFIDGFKRGYEDADTVVTDDVESAGSSFSGSSGEGYCHDTASSRVTRYSERFVLPLPRCPLLCIRSPWGTGKTHAIGVALQGCDKVLAISARKLLAAKAAIDWNLSDYSRVKDDELPPRAAVCVNSIWRVAARSCAGTTVVLDEAILLIDALGGQQLKGRRSEVVGQLRLIARTAARVIFSDAALTVATATALCDLLGLDERAAHWIINDHPAPFPNVLEFEPDDGMAAVKFILDGLRQGQRTAVNCTSRNTAKALAEYVKDALPNLRVLLLTAEDRPDEGCSVDECIAKNNAELLIYSPVVGVGESIQTPFDVVVGLFHAVPGMTADNVVQGLFRVRKPGRVAMWCDSVCTVSGPKSGPAVLHRAIEGIQHVQECIAGSKAPLLVHEEVSAFMGLVADVNVRSTNIRARVHSELRARGIAITHCAETIPEQSQETRKWFKAARATVKGRHAAEVCNAARLSDDEYAKLKRKGNKTRAETRSVERAEIADFYRGSKRHDDVTPPLVLEVDKQGRGREIVQNYASMALISNEIPQGVLVADWASVTGSLWETRGHARATDLRHHLLQSTGLTGPVGTYGGQTPRASAEFIANCVRNVTEIEDRLGIRISTAPTGDLYKRPMKIIGRLLAGLGLAIKHSDPSQRTARSYAITKQSVADMEALSQAEKNRREDAVRAWKLEFERGVASQTASPFSPGGWLRWAAAASSAWNVDTPADADAEQRAAK